VRTIACLVFISVLSFLGGNLQAFEWEIGPYSIDIHGFISQGFLKSDRNNFYAKTQDGTFQFDEFGLTFGVDLSDRLRGGIQLFARDLGEIGNNKVNIDWAYADYRWRDWLGFRAGKIKVPYGSYNETRDIDMLRTSIFLPSSLYAEDIRDAYNAIQGVALYGNWSPPSFGNVNYQFIFGEESISADSGLIRAMNVPSVMELQNFDVTNIFGGNLEWDTPFDGLRVGGTFVKYQWDQRIRILISGGIDRQGNPIPVGGIVGETGKERETIFSMEYEHGKLKVAAEYLRGSGQETGERQEDSEGYYGSVAYRFTDRFELGAYYSVYYPNADDKDGKKLAAEDQQPHYDAWQKEFVLTARFDCNEHWTIKAEGHLINGTAKILWLDNPKGLQEESFLFALKTTFHF
jgi:hypothetical protein